MIYLIPILLSTALGFLALRAILPATARPRLGLLLFFSGTLGLGLSAMISFTSFLLIGQMNHAYIISAHVVLLTTLFLVALRQLKKDPFLPPQAWDNLDITGLILIALLTIPVIWHASLFPMGGWDAWSCWNMKARFLFLGGEDWRNMFDPVLWRSNTAYPFLLPLMNVWLWCWSGTADPLAPGILTCLIAFLTAGILFFTVREITRDAWAALLAPAWVFSLAFAVKLASSQYSDHVVGIFFLAALSAFLLFKHTQARAWLAVMGISLGLLSFAKSEGLVLAVITAGLAGLFLLIESGKPDIKIKRLSLLIIATALAFIPTVIFLLTWSPDGHTFVNGLASADKPATLERLKVIALFFGMEFLSLKWFGFWLLAILAAVLNFRRAFSPAFILIPLSVVIYLLVVGGVYYVNTFFEIVWWLSQTLNRIVFALMPAVALWITASLKE